jgi:peptidoglycan/LPS O-acetylase OafA/YrhL
MRPRKPVENIAVLDWLRGLAILAVFVFHAFSLAVPSGTFPWVGWHRAPAVTAQWALYAATIGWAGVAIFFAVSGFCIRLAHGRAEQDGFRAFFIRRFFRIYPAYLLILAGCLIQSRGWLGARGVVDQAVSHLLLVHNFRDRWIYALNTPLWSIAVEAQLYALYPLVFLGARRWGWRAVLAATAVLELAIRAASSAADPIAPDSALFVLRHSPLAYWFSWTIGAALADEYLGSAGVRPGRRLTWVAWLGAAILCDNIRPLSELAFPAFALATAAGIREALSTDSAPSPTWLTRHFAFLGLLSYGVYLVHLPLEQFFSKIPRRLGLSTSGWAAGVAACAAYPLCLSAAWALHRLVERPGIALGRRVLHRPVPAAEGRRAVG